MGEAGDRDSLAALFLRFLGFGLRAWGGPAAQLAMIRDEAVERSRWLAPERFNRILAVYQVLPGPEATEMCVHLGFLRRGRVGGLVAGLGFVLPGFLLMLAVAALYVALGGADPRVLAALAGFPAAVVALVGFACIRLGGHALPDARHGLVALWACVLTALGAPFYVLLPAAGLALALPRRWTALVLVAGAAVGVLARGWEFTLGPASGGSAWLLGLSGLKAGLLTFGGAYTALPFLRADGVGSYVTAQQFVDGVALSGILPAPFIIFATFLGYVAGGLAGALLMTLGIFLPAFAFTLVAGHRLERLANHPRLTAFLDGVTAAVVGLLVAAWGDLALHLAQAWQVALALVAFLVVLRWRQRWVVPVAVLGCGALGAAVVLSR